MALFITNKIKKYYLCRQIVFSS